MTGALKVAVFVCATAVVTCMGGPAGAEWAVDIYGGASSTASTDLKISGRDDTAAQVRAEIFDLETDTGFTLGVRGGYWFESQPFLGVGLDLFFFSIPVPSQTRSASGTLTGELLDRPITISASGQARIPSVDLPSLAFSPELRLRLPLLRSAEFPKGRLQPYLTGGPAFAFTLEADDLAIIPGGKVGGGASFNVVPWLALFAEYRYTFFPDFEFTTDHLTYKADLNTHHVIVGVSFRF